MPSFAPMHRAPLIALTFTSGCRQTQILARQNETTKGLRRFFPSVWNSSRATKQFFRAIVVEVLLLQRRENACRLPCRGVCGSSRQINCFNYRKLYYARGPGRISCSSSNGEVSMTETGQKSQSGLALVFRTVNEGPIPMVDC